MLVREIRSPGGDVTMTIDDRDVLASLEDLRGMQSLNAEFNRVAKLSGGEFSRSFTKSRLGRAGVNIVRRATPKANKPGAPALTKKMRIAGFKALLTGTNALDGKRMSIRTRNPILWARQFGGTIRAAGGKGLRIRMKAWFDFSPEARRGAQTILIHGRPFLVIKKPSFAGTGFGTHSSEEIVVIASFKSSVRSKRDLFLLEDWGSFSPRVVDRCGAGIVRVLKRLGRNLPEEPEAAEGSGE